MQYPEMFTCLPAQVRVDEPIPRECFANPRAILTVSIVLNDGEAVYLITPARSPKGSKRLIFPQEKALLPPGDKTFAEVIWRCLWEELGIPRHLVSLHDLELSRYADHLPLSRNYDTPVTKNIFFFAASILQGTLMQLREREVRRIERVLGHEFLDSTCCTNRSGKCAAQIEAVIEAVARNLLDRTHWDVFAGDSRLLAQD